MDMNVLEQAGIAETDAAVVATSGDNTNVVIGQVSSVGTARERSSSACSTPRGPSSMPAGPRHRLPDTDRDLVLLETVKASAPTPARRKRDVHHRGRRREVGANVTRSLLEMGHEAHADRAATGSIRPSRGGVRPGRDAGDATEISVLERAGIARPPELLFAVTGDDEDNLVISQIAKEGYGVGKAIARVNDPRNQAHFDLLGIRQTVCATTSILGLVEHEVPEHGLVRLLQLQEEGLEIVEVQIESNSPVAGSRGSAGSSSRRARGSSPSFAMGAPSSWSRAPSCVPGTRCSPSSRTSRGRRCARRFSAARRTTA